MNKYDIKALVSGFAVTAMLMLTSCETKDDEPETGGLPNPSAKLEIKDSYPMEITYFDYYYFVTEKNSLNDKQKRFSLLGLDKDNGIMQVRTYFYPTDDPEEVSLDDYYMYCCLQLEPFEPAETRINTVLNVLNDTSESSSYTFLIENDLTSSNVLHGTYPYFVRGSVVFKNYYASQHIVELELNEVVFRSLAGNSEFMNGTLYCRYTSQYDASPVSWSW